jgi:indolepyruvate decarboxylase
MSLALKEKNPDKRVIAFVGDGAFQMTGMDLITALRAKQNIIVVVLNNHGYTTERKIVDGPFNDLVELKYTEVVRMIGGGLSRKAKTEDELHVAMREALADNSGNFYVIEADVEKSEVSMTLNHFATLVHASD